MKSSVAVKYSDKENKEPMKSEESDGDQDTIASEEDAMSSSSTRTMDEAVNDALLEKLRSHAESSKLQETPDAIRTITAKIHMRVTSADRRIREHMLERLRQKRSRAMEIFVAVLENTKDHITCCSIVSILHESISPRFAGKGSKQRGSKGKGAARISGRTTMNRLIGLGLVQVLIKLLGSLQHAETSASEALAQETLWILGQVAQRDQKFASKMKLLNSIKLLHTMLKQQYGNNKTLLPLLLIVKNLAKNYSTAQALLKDGVAGTLEKTLVTVGYAPHLRLRTLLECMKYLTANRIFCTKFIKAGIAHTLMRIFERWDRFDGQMRLKICDYALSTLQHLCGIRAGRKAIKSNNGLQLLYKFCVSCPEDKAYDGLLSRVCGIINQCLEKKELPVTEMSPARFAIPESGIGSNSAESGSDVESQANSIASLGKLYSDLDSGDENEEENSAKVEDKAIATAEKAEENKFFAGVFTSQRSEEDLVGYNKFFKELGNLESQLRIPECSTNKLSDMMNAIEKDGITLKQEKKIVGKFDGPVNEKSHKRSFENGVTERTGIDIKIFDDVSLDCSEEEVYYRIASRVKSVISFVKVAYPDLIGGDGQGREEPLNTKDRKVCRSKLLTCVERALHASVNSMQDVAYDLDSLASIDPVRKETDDILAQIFEEKQGTGKRCPLASSGNGCETKRLRFESRFESGNLRKAIQIGPREYDLILNPDVNSGSRHQWFYFEISNMLGNVPYTFNIINCEKANSQFNFGMKPILFSVAEAQLGRSGWIRTGADICYYRNCYQRPGRGKNYLTTSFTVNFPHAHDVCYLAYHFPYTYTQLMRNIWKWKKKVAVSASGEPGIYFHVETLCETLNGNENPLLTITAPDSKNNPISNRKMIFLTSRVHPGESNASWVMHGTLEALLSETTYAASLRDNYVFKIVPMLNIEGVVNGCNRYGLTNEDLNRRWSSPNKTLHPVIYHTKGLMEYCTRVLQKPPYVFVDYHGHSRRKNVFLFGCSSSGSWSTTDRMRPERPVEYLMLPYLMQKISPAFALALCSFKVERNKESTARVAVWRQLGVSRSYTMESSFCGCDQGVLAGLHLDTNHLKAIGQDFCQALSMMSDETEDWNVEKDLTRENSSNESSCTENEITPSCESEDECCVEV